MVTVLEQPTSTSALAPLAPPERIVLLGFMGAGKSTVGRLVASQLGWTFIDTDTDVETKCGCSVQAIFADAGEKVFRRHETSALTRALGRRNVVIAVGGGAAESLTNRLLLEQTPGTAVVFLDAPFEVLFDRCVLQEGAAVRPVLLDPDEARERFARRLPFYARCAQHRIRTEEHTSYLTAESVLARILAPR